MAQVFKTEFNSKEQIQCFLKKYKIGITDICEKISRKPNAKGLGSSDKDIIIHKKRNISTFLESHKIECIFSTSKWVTEQIETTPDRCFDTIQIVTLPSPSKQGSRAIGRLEEYKEMKTNGKIKDTIEYREKVYVELMKRLLK